MGFLKKLFGNGDDGDGAATGAPADDSEWRESAEATFDATADRHRVTVWLKLNDPTFETTREQLHLLSLENEIMRAIEEVGAGEHDTNSLDRGFLAIRLIGDDADAIVAIVEPLLGDAPEGSFLAVRRGPATTGEDRVEVGRDAVERSA